MKAYVGILIYMHILQLPDMENYFSTELYQKPNKVGKNKNISIGEKILMKLSRNYFSKGRVVLLLYHRRRRLQS